MRQFGQILLNFLLSRSFQLWWMIFYPGEFFLSILCNNLAWFTRLEKVVLFCHKCQGRLASDHPGSGKLCQIWDIKCCGMCAFCSLIFLLHHMQPCLCILMGRGHKIDDLHCLRESNLPIDKPLIEYGFEFVEMFVSKARKFWLLLVNFLFNGIFCKFFK